MDAQAAVAPVTVARDLTVGDLRRALAAGWRDVLGAPQYGLFFAAIYALGGIAIVYSVAALGRYWLAVPIAAGFPLIAPFAAAGLYEVSRLRETGEPLSWGAVLSAVRGKGDDQLMLLGGMVFVAFSIWLGVAHGVFAGFLGESGMGGHNLFALLLSPAGLAMLVVGGAIGAAFALALYAITVTSLPMLVDRDVDFITAIIVSLGVVRSNGRVMLVWALIIAVLLGLAMTPAFLGLFIALPLLGHATWHLYRRAVG